MIQIDSVGEKSIAGHYHAVLWIDHREARIFHFNAVEAERSLVHADRPTRHPHQKADVIGSGHALEDQDFFERVANSVGDAGIILITGPANAKTELVKHIERCAPEVGTKIATVETVDHPPDRQLLDKATPGPAPTRYRILSSAAVCARSRHRRSAQIE
ncbi:MAG: translational machinery protein [Hyphomicrobiaceae bacterium]